MNIDEALTKFHWLQRAEDDTLEMFLDHHALSSFRMCEGYFIEKFVNSLSYKGGLGAWPLEFGIVFHEVVEYLYESKAISKFDPAQLRDIAVNAWVKTDLDRFHEHKTLIALGGMQGFIALVMQYVTYYSSDLERLRPIATEVAFGKAREVPLGEFKIFEDIQDLEGGYCDNGITGAYRNIRCYLTGRIDFLMDSGTSIGPMDHKTSAFFKNNPMNTFETQEGMTGYIFATNKIIKDKFPGLAQVRSTDRMWMNFIQIKSEPDPQKRFKRVPLFKTPFQLEEYRLRQLRTFKKIFQLVIEGDGVADWNTNLCNSWFYQECMFRNLHRQGTQAAQDLVRITDFKVAEPWDPQKVDQNSNEE